MIKKKILYIIDTLKTGGAEKSLEELVPHLKNWEAIVISIHRGETLKPDLEATGVPVLSLNIKGKFGITEGISKISAIVEKHQPDIIHAFLCRAEQFIRWIGYKYKIPVVNSLVNYSYSKERYAHLTLKGRISLSFYKNLNRLTAGRVSLFMSITRAIIPNNSKALNIDPKKVKVISRGRDIPKLRRGVDPQVVIDLKEKYGSPICLNMSRLLLRKDYLESIKAVNLVIAHYPGFVYLIAGKGHDRPIIEALISELKFENNVFLLGNRHDIPSLLEDSDIFLFPSHYENQGGALVEVTFLGKPIVASKNPVFEELLCDLYSALYEPKNVEDMVDKLIWAIKNRKNIFSLGEAAKRKAENSLIFPMLFLFINHV